MRVQVKQRTAREDASRFRPLPNDTRRVRLALQLGPSIVSPFVAGQIDSPEKWRENMEMALEMFKAQKAMMQQQGGADADDVPVDVDDLDDD